MQSLLVAACLAASLGYAARPAGAQQPPAAVASLKVTHDFDGVSLRRALAELFQGVDARYLVDPDVPNTAVTVRLEEMEFEAALRVVTLLAGVGFYRDGQRYVITNRRPVPPAGPEEVARVPAPPGHAEVIGLRPGGGGRVSLSFSSVPLRRGLAALFEPTGLQYVVEPGVPDIPITINARDLYFTAALRTIVRLAGATYRRSGQVYVIAAREAEALPAAAAPQAGEPKISMNLVNVPVRQALEALSDRSGRQFAIEPSVPDVPVTLTVRELDFTTALRTLVRLARVTYRTEGGVYIVSPGQQPTPPAEAARPEVKEVKLDLDLRDVPFRQALENLFQGTGRLYAVTPDVADVSIRFRASQVEFETAVRALTHLAGTTYEREGNLYLIRARR